MKNKKKKNQVYSMEIIHPFGEKEIEGNNNLIETKTKVVIENIFYCLPIIARSHADYMGCETGNSTADHNNRVSMRN